MSQSVAREVAPATETKFSVRHLFETLRRYLPVIATAFLLVMVGYVILAIARYATAPAQMTSSVAFRLEFARASELQYPNGTRFSPSDITNAPILAKVFADNALGRFMSFDRFKSSVFIVESNYMVEALQREYRAKLNDPKLTPPDRERLEREFETKSKSISRNDYAIHFVYREGMNRIPATIVHKTLSDILSTFAEQAMRDRGGLDFRVPVVTRALFTDVRPGQAENLTIAADVLRTKINRALHTIDTLLLIPGSEVLRTDKEQMSLPEVRSRFEEILRFKLQPLTGRLASSGIDDASTVRTYLTSQIEYNQHRAAESLRRQEALRNALATYQHPDVSAPALREPASAAARSAAGESVTPQVSDSFLDRIVQMATQSNDVRFRQEAVTKIVAESLTLVPYESEAAYYQGLLSKINAGGGNGLAVEEARRQLTEAYNDALGGADQLTEIYRILSKNLNPSNVMYTVTTPPSIRREPTVSLTRLAIYGILVAMLALPMIIAGCLIHNRIKEEEEEELEGPEHRLHHHETA